MHSSSSSKKTKPKRYYDSVTQQLAENSQTVRGVIKQNKNANQNANYEKPNQQPKHSYPQSKQKPNESRTPSSTNNDYFNDDDDDEADTLEDYRLYPSCYNRKKIIVAPLAKTSEHDPKQKQQPQSPKDSQQTRPK